MPVSQIEVTMNGQLAPFAAKAGDNCNIQVKLTNLNNPNGWFRMRVWANAGEYPEDPPVLDVTPFPAIPLGSYSIQATSFVMPAEDAVIAVWIDYWNGADWVFDLIERFPVNLIEVYPPSDYRNLLVSLRK